MDDTVELVRTGAQPFLHVCTRKNLRSLKLWACRIKDFAPLAELTNLVHLEILDFSLGSFSILRALASLKSLRIIGTPRGEKDLGPIGDLRDLTDLSLESPPSWDSSGKTLEFATLQPLSRLANLRRLVLMKATVEKDGLRPLWRLPQLREFRTENTFSMEEFASLAAHAPTVEGDYLLPYHRVNYASCTKCGSQKVQLSGVARGGLLCPTCSSAAVTAHVKAFQSVVRAEKGSG